MDAETTFKKFDEISNREKSGVELVNEGRLTAAAIGNCLHNAGYQPASSRQLEKFACSQSDGPTTFGSLEIREGFKDDQGLFFMKCGRKTAIRVGEEGKSLGDDWKAEETIVDFDKRDEVERVD